MKGSEIKRIKCITWSKLGEDSNNSYKDVEKELISEGFNFIWELENWEDFVRREKKNPDKGTYARYIKEETGNDEGY